MRLFTGTRSSVISELEDTERGWIHLENPKLAREAREALEAIESGEYSASVGHTHFEVARRGGFVDRKGG